MPEERQGIGETARESAGGGAGAVLVARRRDKKRGTSCAPKITVRLNQFSGEKGKKHHCRPYSGTVLFVLSARQPSFKRMRLIALESRCGIVDVSFPRHSCQISSVQTHFRSSVPGTFLYCP